MRPGLPAGLELDHHARHDAPIAEVEAIRIADAPDPASVERLATTWRDGGYRMTALLGEVFRAPEFTDEAAVRSAWDSVLRQPERAAAQTDRDDEPGPEPPEPAQRMAYVDPVAAAAAAVIAGREDLVVSIASSTAEPAGASAIKREDGRR